MRFWPGLRLVPRWWSSQGSPRSFSCIERAILVREGDVRGKERDQKKEKGDRIGKSSRKISVKGWKRKERNPG